MQKKNGGKKKFGLRDHIFEPEFKLNFDWEEVKLKDLDLTVICAGLGVVVLLKTPMTYEFHDSSQTPSSYSMWICHSISADYIDAFMST